MSSPLDTEIRRAVMQIVETSPPPLAFDELSAPEPAPRRAVHRRPRRPALFFVAGLLALVGLIGVVVLLETDTTSPHRRSPASGATTTPETRTSSDLTVTALNSIKYDQRSYTVPAGTVHLTLSGALGHTLRFDDPTHSDVGLAIGEPPDDHPSQDVELSPGSYTIYCEIPGHREAGMQATIVVTST